MLFSKSTCPVNSNKLDFVCRNQAYVSHIQLAVFLSNHHINRETRRNKNGEVMYQRKYRKQTKWWDVTPLLVLKDYNYIPKLIEAISREHISFNMNLKHKQPEPLHYPCNIQKKLGIGHQKDIRTSCKLTFPFFIIIIHAFRST